MNITFWAQFAASFPPLEICSHLTPYSLVSPSALCWAGSSSCQGDGSRGRFSTLPALLPWPSPADKAELSHTFWAPLGHYRLQIIFSMHPCDTYCYLQSWGKIKGSARLCPPPPASSWGHSPYLLVGLLPFCNKELQPRDRTTFRAARAISLLWHSNSHRKTKDWGVDEKAAPATFLIACMVISSSFQHLHVVLLRRPTTKNCLQPPREVFAAHRHMRKKINTHISHPWLLNTSLPPGDEEVPKPQDAKGCQRAVGKQCSPWWDAALVSPLIFCMAMTVGSPGQHKMVPDELHPDVVPWCSESHPDHPGRSPSHSWIQIRKKKKKKGACASMCLEKNDVSIL